MAVSSAVSVSTASILALITSAASIAVGFGFFGVSTEQVVISVAGTVVAAVGAVLNEVRHKTVTQANTARGVKTTLS